MKILRKANSCIYNKVGNGTGNGISRWQCQTPVADSKDRLARQDATSDPGAAGQNPLKATRRKNTQKTLGKAGSAPREMMVSDGEIRLKVISLCGHGGRVVLMETALMRFVMYYTF